VRASGASLAAVMAVAVAGAGSGCAGISRDDLEKRILEIKGGAVPAGTVVAYAGDNLPAGWLWCDGSEYDVVKFPALAAAIGHSHGSSDFVTRFKVPDYRGRFLRGVDRGAGRDPDAAKRTPMATGGNKGDNVGTLEGDALAAHQHDIPKSTAAQGEGVMNFAAGNPDLVKGIVRTSQTGASETRPVNASVNWIIRAI
jgi:microcystin-dependent protein